MTNDQWWWAPWARRQLAFSDWGSYWSLAIGIWSLARIIREGIRELSGSGRRRGRSPAQAQVGLAPVKNIALTLEQGLELVASLAVAPRGHPDGDDGVQLRGNLLHPGQDGRDVLKAGLQLHDGGEDLLVQDILADRPGDRIGHQGEHGIL